MKNQKEKNYLVSYAVMLLNKSIFRNTIIYNMVSKEAVYNYIKEHPEVIGKVNYEIAILNIIEL